ncbi:MAG: DMT family transporter, partial [Fimbriimonadaceae bacterium]|nr:DMT family transporter [Alphaproteobacteria bacterium]
MTTGTDTEPQSETSGRAYLLLVFAALCWGGNAVFGRLAVGEVSPVMLVFLRWVGVVLLLIVIARKPIRNNWPTMRPHLAFLCAMGAIGYTGFNVLFYIAAKTTTAVNIGILQGSIPVMVLVGAFAVYRNRIRPVQMIGVAATMVGVVTVASQGEFANLAALAFNIGDLLMLIACVCYAGYTLGLRSNPPAASIALFAVMAGAALLATIPLVLVEAALGQIQLPTTRGLVIIGLIVLLPSFLAQIAFIRGVEQIGPARAGIFVNLVPIFASVLAILILNEPFRMYHG